MNSDSAGVFYEDVKEVIVCLFDGNYYLGAGALINSLTKAGFKGVIYAGYRNLPEWVNQLKAIDDKRYYVTTEIIIVFEQVKTHMNLGYYKPYFLKEAMEVFASTNKFYYFDVDIIIKAPWPLFSSWLDIGLCLCLDNAFYFLHHNHPWRKMWKSMAADYALSYNMTNNYFNSGFLGIDRDSASVILDRWIYFTEKYIESGGDIYRFNKDDFSSLKGDQDLLNAAITISPDIEISVVGKEGMGFKYPATFMFHAVGDTKPWNNFFLKRLIRSGNRPSMPEKQFFKFSNLPIRLFPKVVYLIKKTDQVAASVLGRLLG